ncbi:MAG: hypothetical protein Q8K99_11445 [Actinomycetota bacterium]|nr:hypothetical protein [Actinomycetota bacterium]
MSPSVSASMLATPPKTNALPVAVVCSLRKVPLGAGSDVGRVNTRQPLLTGEKVDAVYHVRLGRAQGVGAPARERLAGDDLVVEIEHGGRSGELHED